MALDTVVNPFGCLKCSKNHCGLKVFHGNDMNIFLDGRKCHGKALYILK